VVDADIAATRLLIRSNSRRRYTIVVTEFLRVGVTVQALETTRSARCKQAGVNRP